MIKLSPMHQSIDAAESFHSIDLEEATTLDKWGNASNFDEAYDEAREMIDGPMEIFISEENNYLVFIPANEDSEKEEQSGGS